jgi:hypothetical protein
LGIVVMAGHRRPKDGVASRAYVPAISIQKAWPRCFALAR